MALKVKPEKNHDFATLTWVVIPEGLRQFING